MTSTRWIAPLLLGSALLIGACGGQEDGPELPGADTLKLNHDMVKQMYSGGASTSALQGSGGDLGSKFQYDHVTNAIIRGGIAGTVIGVGAAPHAVAWDAALIAGYTWDPQAKLWRSETTVTVYGKTYALEAQATINPAANKNSYKMFVDGKLMTTGSSDFYLTAGTWELHDPSRPTPEKVVEVKWDRSNPNLHSVSGLVVDPQSKYPGTSATLTRAGSLYTLVVDVQPQSQSYFEIVIDSVSRQGSILSPSYNSGLKGCWGSNYKDTPCN